MLSSLSTVRPEGAKGAVQRLKLLRFEALIVQHFCPNVLNASMFNVLCNTFICLVIDFGNYSRNRRHRHSPVGATVRPSASSSLSELVYPSPEAANRIWHRWNVQRKTIGALSLPSVLIPNQWIVYNQPEADVEAVSTRCVVFHKYRSPWTSFLEYRSLWTAEYDNN